MNMTGKLIITELKLLVREPLVLAFVFAFPIVTVLVLGGVFGKDDPAFQGVDPANWYVAGYLAVVIAAIGLIMMPVHLASYRDQGVLRRFAAGGLPAMVLRRSRTRRRPHHHDRGIARRYSPPPARSTASRASTTRCARSPASSSALSPS